MGVQVLTRPVLRSQLPPLAIAGATAVAAFGAYRYFSTPARKPGEPPKTFSSGPAFKSLKLHSVEKLNHDSSRFRFALPSDDAVSGLSLTSAILTLTRPNGQWKPVIRPYTPTSNLNEAGFIDLVIKRYPGGQASTHIHSLKPGDSLFVLGTLKAYPWKTNEFKHITLIAGGAGITPMIQLLNGIFSNPEEETKVTLLHGINTDADALFKEEFEKMEREFPGRFKVVHTVTQPGPESIFRRGRVTKALIEETLVGVGGVNGTGKVFICGPPPMEEALTGSRKTGAGILGELGVEKGKIFKF